MNMQILAVRSLMTWERFASRLRGMLCFYKTYNCIRSLSGYTYTPERVSGFPHEMFRPNESPTGA